MSTKPIKSIRAAVIGGGAFGECHLKTYHSMAQVEVAGLYTLEKDRGNALCQRYGGRLYGSLDELASDPGIDVVSIVTPEDAHFASFKALAEQQKAIYVEKPLATSMNEAEEMLVMSKSLIAMCGHCLRFESRVAHVWEQRKRLGRLHHMSFKSRRPRKLKLVYGRAHPALVLLCHETELANAFAGVPFRRVCALESHFSQGQIDGMSMLVEYENGTTCAIEGGFYLTTQDFMEENDLIALDFEGGTYSIALPNAALAFQGPEGTRFINQQYETSVYGMEFGALRAALEYMTHCVSHKVRPQISTIEDGYNAVCLARAAIQSVALGRWIERTASENTN